MSETLLFLLELTDLDFFSLKLVHSIPVWYLKAITRFKWNITSQSQV
ncbi:MAG: hypothetical protein M3Y76_12355 [Chloroflexota bacterium]|nr:hypothetical protein [Chloroflexota bacterium]